MSNDLAPRTPDDICTEINACSTKLAQAEKKAQDWRDTRRQFLQELKDKFPDIWLKEVKEKCNIGRAMAYRILQLPPPEKSSENNGPSSTSRQAEHSSEEEAKHQEERPRDIAIRLSSKAPETPEELAADAILLVESFFEQYQIDLQLTRAALIRMLTAAHKARIIEGDATAEKSPWRRSAVGHRARRTSPRKRQCLSRRRQPMRQRRRPRPPLVTASILRTALRSVQPITTTTSVTQIIRCIDRCLIRRCSHDCRTLYGRTARRAPYARREIRLLLLRSCDFFSRQRTRNRNLVA